MTQQDVIDYLEVNDCFVYKERQKDDGVHFTIRKNGTKNIAIVYPVRRGTYTPAAVCHICNQLGVQVPNFGQGMQETLNEVKANAKELKNKMVKRKPKKDQ